MNKLLTIYIPTYNRATCLEKLLVILTDQVTRNRDYCQLIISDNCSTDNTGEVCKKFTSDCIIYEKNEVNIGAARNFKKAYYIPNLKYLWIIGDDDLVSDNAIDVIISYLMNSNYSMVYLNNNLIVKNKIQVKLKINNNIICELSEFYKNVGCDLTFISTMIYNISCLDDYSIIENNSENHFLQTYVASNCLKSQNSNLIISEALVSSYNNINTSYSLYSLFGRELFDVTRYQIIQLGFNKKIVNKTYIKYISKVVLPGIIGAKMNKNKKMLSNFGDFFYATKRYSLSWFYIYPLLLLPSSFYRFIRKIIRKIRRY